mgnify:CR=1 FL=1
MKKMILLFTLTLLLIFSLVFSVSAQNKPELHVFAAASLTDALDELIGLYQEDGAFAIVPIYESSGTLRQQIEEGADADIFISANQKHMDTLETAELIVPDTRLDLLGNTLTLIASAEKAAAVKEIEKFKDAFLSDEIAFIAIGEPSDVPAGQYAQEMFESLGIWDAIQDKLVFAKNVRAVLTYVDTADADLGLVYRTDALELENGEIISDAPEGTYTAVNYPIAVLAEAPQPEGAQEFYEFLLSDKGKEIFEKYGFTFLVEEE